MEVLEVTPTYYDEIFIKPNHVYNTAAFNELNKQKCDKIYYLIFKDTKIRLGIIFGRSDSMLKSPFSAPFGGFQYVSDDVSISQIDDALKCLEEWVILNQIHSVKITNSPLFYDNNFLSKVQNSLFRENYKNATLDINYQFPTYKFDNSYLDIIWYNAKKNLKKGIRANLTFEKLPEDSGEKAYDIIAENRKQRGFPLRMSWKQLHETTQIIKTDYFIVKKQEVSIAAAIIFHVTDTIVQVIYWGDLPEFSDNKTMNFLAYEIFKFYKETGIQIVDIGPSTEDSIPNNGLCSFKESIGCDLSLKSIFTKKFT